MSYHSSHGAVIQQGAAGLGGAPPSVFAYKDGSVGGRAGHAPGALRSYRDGSLGEYFSGTGSYMSHLGPVQAYDDGSLGEYFSGTAGCGACGEVAAETVPGVLNMQDPVVVREVKALMAAATPEVAVAQGAEGEAKGGNYYDERFYASGVWGVKADQLWKAADAGIRTKIPGITAPLSSTKGEHAWPNAEGILAAYQLAIRGGLLTPEAALSTMPTVVAFVGEAAAAEGGKVTEPFFSEEESIKGKSAWASMGTVAKVGLVGGGVALVVFLATR